MSRDYKSFDVFLFILVLGLSIFGIIIIGSATGIASASTSTEFEKQKLWLISGLVLMGFSVFIDYKIICKFFIPIYLAGFLMLLVLMFMGIRDSDPVTRWLEIGSFVIQPSEFFKIILIIFFAELIERYHENLNKPLVLIAMLAAVGVPVVMIMIQPSLSAALVNLVVGLSLIFVGGLNFLYIISTVALLVPAGLFFFFDVQRESPILIDKILNTYQIGRILTFLNPDPTSDSYYQTNQGIRAIGSGALYGKGLFQGAIIQNRYLPAAHNDFIFAVIGEELGFVGCITVLFVILLIIAKCLHIAFKAVDLRGKLIASGVAALLSFETIVNVGVSTGLLPNTGMPLPFISYGGSACWVHMIAIGLVLNVGLARQKSLFEPRGRKT